MPTKVFGFVCGMVALFVFVFLIGQGLIYVSPRLDTYVVGFGFGYIAWWTAFDLFRKTGEKDEGIKRWEKKHAEKKVKYWKSEVAQYAKFLSEKR